MLFSLFINNRKKTASLLVRFITGKDDGILGNDNDKSFVNMNYRLEVRILVLLMELMRSSLELFVQFCIHISKGC